MPKNRIYIPTYISSVNYAPARVLPHIYFYNGLKACETYYLQGYTNGNTGSVTSNALEAFPYFDNYEGQDPTSGSRSLLFFNEPAVYGTTPTGSLYSDYWETYVSLLYNPRTRLFNCEAIIPLADYFKMELNDIVEWRGNYYHLRAINDYNLSNGECKLQLLGPILGDILPSIIPAIACDFDFSASCAEVIPPPTTTTTQAPTTTTTLAPTTTTTVSPFTTTTTTSGPCNCFEYDVTISQLDIDDATGNTGTLAIYNGNIIINYTDCAGNPTEDLSGTGTAVVCADINVGVSLTYFKNNMEALAIYSTAAQTEVECCPLTQFNNCGRGDTVGESCSDAVNNARTFFSDCNNTTFGVGCFVYSDSGGTPLIGFSNVFMNLSNWDVNPSTGVVTASSSTQC